MPKLRPLIPLIVIFISFMLLPLIFSGTLHRYSVNPDVIIGANIILFAITLISYMIQMRGMQAKNPHVFVRSITMGMLMKMVVCIIVVILYVSLSGAAYNKRGIFLALFLYLLYLFVEVVVMMKLNTKRHA